MPYAAYTIRIIIIIHRILKILCVIYTRSNHNVSTIRSKVLNCLAFGYNICYLACKITHTMTYVHAIRPNAIFWNLHFYIVLFATICAMACKIVIHSTHHITYIDQVSLTAYLVWLWFRFSHSISFRIAIFTSYISYRDRWDFKIDSIQSYLTLEVHIAHTIPNYYIWFNSFEHFGLFVDSEILDEFNLILSFEFGRCS